MSPLCRYYHEYLENITTFPARVGTTTCDALIDTGATRSVMSEKYIQTLVPTPVKHLYNVSVRLASGSNLQPLGLVNCSFHLEPQVFTFDFIMCKNLTRPLI